jgi:hypothetical protein
VRPNADNLAQITWWLDRSYKEAAAQGNITKAKTKEKQQEKIAVAEDSERVAGEETMSNVDFPCNHRSSV